MGRTIRAAVLERPGTQIRTEELELVGQVPARSSCGSPRAASATRTCTRRTATGAIRPMVLGHEGAGYVDEVGSGVEVSSKATWSR